MRRKYNNEKPTYRGITFDSKKELKRFKELEELLIKKRISNLQLQVPYVLIDKQRSPDGKAVREMKYIADFVYECNGETIVEDVKGYRFGVAYNTFKIKQKLMLQRYGIWIKEI